MNVACFRNKNRLLGPNLKKKPENFGLLQDLIWWPHEYTSKPGGNENFT